MKSNLLLRWRDSWRESTLSTYVPVVGEDAARWQWRANEMHIWFSAFMIISVFPTVALALSEMKLAAWIYFGITFPLAISFVLARFIFRHRFFRSATKTLGVAVNFLHPVEARRDRYEDWCRDRDIEPLTRRTVE